MKNTKSIHLHHQPRKTKNGVVNNYSLATALKKDGKDMKKIIHRVGILTDEQAANYRAYLKALNKGIPLKQLVNINEIVYEEDVRYWDVLILESLWRKIGINKIFNCSLKNNQFMTTEQMAKILCINKLLDPLAKVRTIPWVNETMLPKIMGFDIKHYNKTKIFGELTKIHKHKDKIESYFIEFSRKLSKVNMDEIEIFYMDGSTSTFEGKKCGYAEFDIDKTRGFYPYVIGFVLVTDKRGFPIAWEVIRGKEKDKTTFKKLADRIRNKYKIKEITYCFDRGVASVSNFELIENFNSKFITGINDNQIKNIFDLNKFEKIRKKILDYCELPVDKQRGILPLNGFCSADKQYFYRDLEVINNKRYVAIFNVEMYYRENETREKNIREVLLDVEQLNHELAHAKRDREYSKTEKKLLEILNHFKLATIFGYKLIPKASKFNFQSFQIKLSYKKERLRELNSTDGLMVYITDHTEKDGTFFRVSAYDITMHYKNKYVVENAFREMKSFLSLRPFYVRTEDHVEAHFDIGVIDYFINQYIHYYLSIPGQNFEKYLIKALAKSFESDVSIIKTYLDDYKINIKKVNSAGRIKELVNKANNRESLSDRFLEKIEKDYPICSLREFYRELKKLSPAVKLASPQDVEIWKCKSPNQTTKDALKKLGLNYLIPSKQHTSLNVYM